MPCAALTFIMIRCNQFHGNLKFGNLMYGTMYDTKRSFTEFLSQYKHLLQILTGPFEIDVDVSLQQQQQQIQPTRSTCNITAERDIQHTPRAQNMSDDAHMPGMLICAHLMFDIIRSTHDRMFACRNPSCGDVMCHSGSMCTCRMGTTSERMGRTLRARGSTLLYTCVCVACHIQHITCHVDATCVYQIPTSCMPRHMPSLTKFCRNALFAFILFHRFTFFRPLLPTSVVASP